MKTKLLKRVRRRFSIIHKPQGFISCGTVFNYNLFVLYDNDNEYYAEYAQLGHKEGTKQYCSDIFETEKDCIDFLTKVMIDRLKSEGYTNRRMKEIRKAQNKVWYNSES